MKGLIIAGGCGKRLGDKTLRINKCMLFVNGRRLIEYSLENAYKYVDELLIVVGYVSDQIINTYGNQYKGIKISYVFQEEQRGLVHAIQCAQGKISNEKFMLFLGDEIIINPKHQNMLEKYMFENCFCVCGVVKVEDKSLITDTYSILSDSENSILELIEKPEEPFNYLMGTGNCILSDRFFSYIDDTPISPLFKERLLTDVIQTAIKNGECAKWNMIGSDYFNINKPSDISRAEALLRTNGNKVSSGRYYGEEDNKYTTV